MSSETNGEVSGRCPCADVYVTEQSVLLEIEVPGVAADELVVAVAEQVVTVSGHDFSRRTTRQYLLHERSPREFSRAFHLPVGTVSADLTSQLRDGVLAIRVPRTEWVHPAPIDVEPTIYQVHPDCVPI